MSASVANHPLVTTPLHPRSPPTANMSRPQVGIERLPARRPTNEPREAMNCKSCRKRKIKCNRLRPTCEACVVFRCACIYDAVPKKRGPKQDVLEALLKRVDGLEQKLKDQKKRDSESRDGAAPVAAEGAGSDKASSPTRGQDAHASSSAASAPAAPGHSAPGHPEPGHPRDELSAEPPRPRVVTTTNNNNDDHDHVDTAMSDGVADFANRETQPELSPAVHTDTLLHTYFTRSHAKPFHILDEASFRHRLQLNQIPSYLLGSVCALASRYAPHPGGYNAAVRLGEEYARQARSEIDTDEPSIDCLQALLLLALAFVASGKGKKSYMLLSNAIGMSVALELHREMDASVPVPPVEREMRRRLFWTCYLLDRFMACGSRRPSLIDDSTVLLRLPSWLPSSASMPLVGGFFPGTSNLQLLQGGGSRKLQGGSAMLIDISRILGITNRYLAAGGVKGDSHFPWHSLSNLSKIRQDLDAWAVEAQDIFSSVETLFSQPDSTVLVMSKLIYHLIHCLIYRPFLPVDLSELSGSGQHQSWQIEATNLCFLHANAIAELTELGKRMPQIEWPGFVGYCICTAGTVHIHGVHYSSSKHATVGDASVFAASAEFLSREMQHLAEMRHAWACVQHHRRALQSIYNAHTELTKSVSRSSRSSPSRFAPVFQLEDFFDRYTNIGGPGGPSFYFDASNLTLADVVVDFAPDEHDGERYLWRGGGSHASQLAAHGLQSPTTRQQSAVAGFAVDASARTMPAGRGSFGGGDRRESTFASLGSGMGSHGIPQARQQDQQHMFSPSSASFSPLFNYSSPALGHAATVTGETTAPSSTNANNNGVGTNIALSGYDPMFPSTIPTNTFSSPSPWHPVDETDQDAASRGAGGPKKKQQQSSATGMQQQSPDGGLSSDGSVGGVGTRGEEKDPFLSLLEELAENEYAQDPESELEFFLSGSGHTQ